MCNRQEGQEGQNYCRNIFSKVCIEHQQQLASKLRDIEFPLQRWNIKIQATVTKEEEAPPAGFEKQSKLHKAHFPNEVGRVSHKTWIGTEV